MLGRAASLYTDPFIMLSGLLTTYSLIGKLQRTNKISITDEYISRLFRILPTLGSLILFCTFILPYLNAGPLWNQVVTHHADICKQNWWRNILFIHNYFGFKDMVGERLLMSLKCKQPYFLVFDTHPSCRYRYPVVFPFTIYGIFALEMA